MSGKEHDFADNYKRGETPWDSGQPDAELLRVLDSGQLSGKTLLEIGCGTGTNAVELARRGFDVVAIDSVAQAVEAARKKAAAANVKIDFRTGDALSADLGGPYDVIFDRGVYHYLRRVDLKNYQALLQRVTRPGSIYFSLAGNAKEQTEYGPPRVHEHEIRVELEGLFEIIELRETHFITDKDDFRPLAWAILMRRR
jgi:methyl halide transferase